MDTQYYRYRAIWRIERLHRAAGLPIRRFGDSALFGLPIAQFGKWILCRYVELAIAAAKRLAA